MHHNIRLWNAAATGNIGEIRRQVRLAKTYNRTREQSFPDFLSSSNTANGHTALVSASIGGHLPCMKLLIREGSSLDHTDKKGMTPLMHSAIHGRAGCVKLLLLSLGDSEKQKRLLRFRDERGLTALDLARVAQKDWVFARKRVSAIGSFIANKTYSKRRQGGKHALSSLLPPHGDQTDSHVDQAIDFQWTIELLLDPPNPIVSEDEMLRVGDEEGWAKDIVETSDDNTTEGGGIFSSYNCNGPMVYLSIHHDLWALAVPNISHQAAIGKAARHCSSLRLKMEKARTLKEIKLIVSVLQPVLGITKIKWKKGRGKILRQAQLSLNEKIDLELAKRRSGEEKKHMLGEDAYATKIRPYLTCARPKLRYLTNIYNKLAAGVHLSTLEDKTHTHDLEAKGGSLPANELTAKNFARFCTLTGELLNAEKTRTILSNIRKQVEVEYGNSFWPAPILGIVEFVMFWLKGEQEEKSNNQLPEWMVAADGDSESGDKTMLEEETLPQNMWLKRLKTRQYVEKHASLVSAKAGRLGFLTKFMSSITYSLSADSGRKTKVSRLSYLIKSERNNPKPPPMKKEIVVEREKRKEDQLLVKELLKVGNTGMDAEKAERVLQAQQKKREEFSEKAKVEADRQKLMQQKRTEKERKELAEKAKKDKRRKERKEKKIEMERKKDQRRKQRELRQKMSKGKKGGRHRSKMRRTA
jgi:hypothetical protein